MPRHTVTFAVVLVKDDANGAWSGCKVMVVPLLGEATTTIDFVPSLPESGILDCTPGLASTQQSAFSKAIGGDFTSSVQDPKSAAW